MSGLKLPLSRETWQLLEVWEDQLYSGLKKTKNDTELDLRLKDPEAHTLVQKLPNGKQSVSLVIPLDNNDQKDDGRIYLKDTFIFDESGQVWESFQRDFDLHNPSNEQTNRWKQRLEDLRGTARPTIDIRQFVLGGVLSHARPFYANKEFWNIVSENKDVQSFLTKMAEDAQSAFPTWRARGPDADSHFVVKRGVNEAEVIVRWVLDRDAEPGNGRIFIEDTFRLDPKTQEVVDYKRKYVGKDYPWTGGDAPGSTKEVRTLLKDLNQIPQPELKDATAFFNATKPTFFQALNLSRVGTEDPQPLWENKPFFKSLGSTGKQFIVNLVEDARKLDSNLYIQTSNPKNQYQVRFLAGRIEVLFTYLVNDYEDPSKNQIVCYDRFVFKRDLSKLYTHSRYYKAVEATFPDKSLLNKIDQVNEEWRSDESQALKFIQNVYPTLRPASISATEEAIDESKNSEALELIPEGYVSPVERSLQEGVLTKNDKELLVEGAGILMAVANEKLQLSYDRSQGWAHRGKGVNLTGGRDTLNSIFQKLSQEVEKASTKQDLETLLLNLNLTASENEVRSKILADPLMQKVLDVGSELDEKIREQDLMVLAREELFKRQKMPAAAITVASFVSERSPQNKDATELLAFINGGGSTATKIEYMGSQIIDHVFDEKMLLAMGGASLMGSVFEAGGLVALGRLGTVGRLGATGVGITGEALAFTGIHKLAQSAVSDPKKVWSNWGGETLHAMMLFGFMRGAHGMTGLLGQGMAKGPLNTIFTKGEQGLVAGMHPTARLTGHYHPPFNPLGKSLLGTLNFAGGVESMYLANWAGHKLGLTPPSKQSFAHDQFDALTTYLTAMVGYRLVNGVTGGQLNYRVGELKLRSKTYRELLKNGWKPGESLPAPFVYDLPKVEKKPEAPDPVPEPKVTANDLGLPKINFEMPRYLPHDGFVLSGEKSLNGIPKMVRKVEPFGELAAITEEGGRKGTNEDAFAWGMTPHGLVLINLDGMGGQKGVDPAGKMYGGKEASELASEIFIQHLGQGREFEAVAELAHQGVFTQYKGAGACFAGARIIPSTEAGSPDQVKFYWAGDVKGMLLRRGPGGKWNWVYQTQDNSLSRLQVDGDIESGSLDPGKRQQAIATHMFNHVVTKGLGMDFSLSTTSQGEVPSFQHPGFKLADGMESIPIERGDLLLLFSDGVSDNVIDFNNFFEMIKTKSTTQDIVDTIHQEMTYRMKILGESDSILKGAHEHARFGFVYEGLDIRLRDKALYINKDGFVFDASDGGNLVGKFKSDNISVAAYRHLPGPRTPPTVTPPPVIRKGQGGGEAKPPEAKEEPAGEAKKTKPKSPPALPSFEIPGEEDVRPTREMIDGIEAAIDDIQESAPGRPPVLPTGSGGQKVKSFPTKLMPAVGQEEGTRQATGRGWPTTRLPTADKDLSDSGSSSVPESLVPTNRLPQGTPPYGEAFLDKGGEDPVDVEEGRPTLPHIRMTGATRRPFPPKSVVDPMDISDSSLTPIAQLRGVDVDAIQKKVHRLVRSKIEEEARARVHRAPPDTPLENQFPMEISLDVGIILQDPNLKGKKVKVSLIIYPSKNKITVQPETLNKFRTHRATEDRPSIRGLLEALESLHLKPIREEPITRRPPPLPEEEKTSKIVLPANPHVVKYNRSKLAHYDIDQESAPRSWASSVLARNTYLVGEIFMDSEGRIQDLNLSRPDFQSPRVSKSIDDISRNTVMIPVIVSGDTIVWSQEPKNLNSRQGAELIELTKGADGIRRGDHYALDVISQTHQGPLALDLARLVEDFISQTPGNEAERFQIHLVNAAGGLRAYATRPKGAEASGLKTAFGSLEPVGTLSVVVQPQGSGPLGRNFSIKFRLMSDVPFQDQLQPLLEYVSQGFSNERFRADRDPTQD